MEDDIQTQLLTLSAELNWDKSPSSHLPQSPAPLFLPVKRRLKESPRKTLHMMLNTGANGGPREVAMMGAVSLSWEEWELFTIARAK